jgi:hypothetical protein
MKLPFGIVITTTKALARENRELEFQWAEKMRKMCDRLEEERRADVHACCEETSKCLNVIYAAGLECPLPLPKGIGISQN